MAWLLVGMALVVWILLAAKAHGRQIRLEREAKGVFAVDFRGTNPPEVVAIWRRDRRIFWPTMAVLTVVFGASALFAGDWVEAAFAPGVAFAASFMVAGLASWARLGGGNWASFGWWTLVALGLAATVLALRV